MSQQQTPPRPPAEQPTRTTQRQPGTSHVAHGTTGGQQPAQQHSAGNPPESRTFPTANDLPPATRGPVIQRLNETLADTTDLMSQAKFAHWNVKGINFYQLHLLFDELHEVFEDHADLLAERTTALGGQAMGTTRMAAARSSIPELTPDLVTGSDYLEALSAHVALHATNLRDAIEFAASHGDEDTADLFTELSREVDQQLYFLESHLQTGFEGTVTQLQSGAGMTAQPGQQTSGGGVARQTFQAGSMRQVEQSPPGPSQ